MKKYTSKHRNQAILILAVKASAVDRNISASTYEE